MKTHLLPIVLMIVLAMVLVGCAGNCRKAAGDSEAISNTLEGFYSAYNAEDWDTCLSYVDDEYGAGAAIIELLKASKATTGEVIVNSIDNISIAGSTATADVSATFRGKIETVEHGLVKKDSNWKVSLEH